MPPHMAHMVRQRPKYSLRKPNGKEEMEAGFKKGSVISNRPENDNGNYPDVYNPKPQALNLKPCNALICLRFLVILWLTGGC